MELKVPSSVELQIKPTADGQFGRTPLEVDVSTNNTAGYKLTMVSDNDTLKQRLTGTDYKINSLSTNVTCASESETLCAEFPVGKWGYRVSNATSYAAVSTTTPQVLRETELAADSSKTTLYFGSKLDNTTPTGTYGGVQLTFTATTNIVTYSISYERGNESASDVTGLPDQQTGKLETEMDTPVTLAAGSPSRTNYDFKGWCVNAAPTLNEDTLTDTCNGNIYQPNQSITLNPTESVQIKLYAIWEVKKPAITFNFDSGISKVTATGKFGSSTDTAQDVATSGGKLNLMSGQSYRITITYKDGYEAASTNALTQTAGAGTLSSDSYMPNEAVATLSATSQKRKYTVTIKTNTNVTKVTLNNTECASTSGCTVSGLTFDESYNLTAEFATGYGLDTWGVSGAGSVANANNATTTFKVGAGDATITPTAKANTYTCTKKYELENADGSWATAVTDTTEQVAYGSTCSYSVTKTDYKGSASGTNGSAATASGTMNSTSGITVTAKLYRNTFTLTVNRDTTNISSASTTTSAVHGSNYYRWGQSVNITATAASNSKFKNWTQSGTSGTFGSTTNASTTFTMGKGNVTVTANGEASGMQGMTSCPVSGNNTTKITDTRDNNEYTIGMVNGKCWMLDNLRLVGSKTLTSADTNLPSGVTFNLPASGANFADDTAGRTNAAVNSGSATLTGNGSNSYTSGKYGVYYNYCAASAGGICTDTNYSNGSADRDICPKGWRLPTKDEYDSVVNVYGSVSALTTALHLPFSGYFYNGSPYHQGSNGRFWSSTYYNSASMYYLYVGSSDKNTSGYDRGNGSSVRCVLKSS